LYLVDGHAVMYRFHFAFKENPMRTSSGAITSAAFGMAKLLAVLMKNYPMTHLAVIFDPPYRTWRKDFYPDYKANRTDKDDISAQIEMTYALVNTWGIYTGAWRPLEADDVIGILAKRAAAQGWDVRIATKDKDFMQLVDDRIKLIDLGKAIGQDEATVIDREAVHTKFGVYPEQIIDYLSLVGDTSDNVPGIDGIGPGWAAKLLTEHGNLEGLWANLDKLPKAKKAACDGKWETMERNRKLIRLAFEYGLDVPLEALVKPPLHNVQLFEMLEQLEFFSIIKTLS
jgi:DNA polymerase-1